MAQASNAVQSTMLDAMRRRLGLPLVHLAEAQSQADIQKRRIREALADVDLPENTSLVVFGSLARGEWTSGSDVDWTLLIDGPADPEHFRLAADFGRRFAEVGFAPPGRTETFGTLSSSHELVHHIGGDDDTNRNMTRRILLLLESDSISGELVHQRVIRAILDRYIRCGAGVPDPRNPNLRVPRFLLNDVVRLWRTFGVDYAAKKWQRSNEGWALRNAKLRVPRKLTFIKGLLLCLDCELLPGGSPWADTVTEGQVIDDRVLLARLVIGCFALSRMPPLQLLARVLAEVCCDETASEILRAYDEYVWFIDNAANRTHLAENVDFDTAVDDLVFREVRRIGRQFGDGLQKLFFTENAAMSSLIQKHGVF